jgi:predicted RNase H-like nuclease (RuvC/YqgF family)
MSSVKFGTPREADEIAKRSKIEKRLQAAAKKRWEVVESLQSEIDLLKEQLTKVSNTSPLKHRKSGILTEKQKEVRELTLQIEEATRENQRLKQITAN